MANKQQIRNLLQTMHLHCITRGNAIIITESVNELKQSKIDYLISKGFIHKSDDILGEWLEYQF